jgi:thiosulfate/3-mercaptopyruvate sulfurtransferase
LDLLVSTDWLERELGAADLKVVDATVFLPGAGRDARAEHEAAHIPGAVFMDLDGIVDPAHPAPHMLPPADRFASRMRGLGLGDADRIVAYDNSPLHSAARAWWMLRAFGARDVAVLDGGFQKWLAEGRPTEAGATAKRPGHFSATRDPSAVVGKDDVRGIVQSRGHEIVDARPASRFAGLDPEPRPGVAAGHIPGSRNLPQSALFNPDNRMRSPEALRAAFAEAGVDLGKPLVTTCGSGITAAVLLLAAHVMGKTDVRLYDGSWAEWGADPATPKATGAA